MLAGGPGPFETTITVTLPPGFDYFTPTAARPAPAELDSLTPAAGGITGPTVTDDPNGQVLVWTALGIQADTDYTLSFRTTPGLTLGDASAVAKIVDLQRQQPRTAGRSRVVDTNDAPGTAALALPVETDVLYLGYVDRAGRRRPVRVQLHSGRPGWRSAQPPRR